MGSALCFWFGVFAVSHSESVVYFFDMSAEAELIDTGRFSAHARLQIFVGWAGIIQAGVTYLKRSRSEDVKLCILRRMLDLLELILEFEK